MERRPADLSGSGLRRARSGRGLQVGQTFAAAPQPQAELPFAAAFLLRAHWSQPRVHRPGRASMLPEPWRQRSHSPPNGPGHCRQTGPSASLRIAASVRYQLGILRSGSRRSTLTDGPASRVLRSPGRPEWNLPAQLPVLPPMRNLDRLASPGSGRTTSRRMRTPSHTLLSQK